METTKYMTIKEFCELTKISTSTAYRLIRNGNPFGKEDIAEVTGERPAEGTELELTCVRVYNSDGEFCGLYRREQGGRRYKPEKMFLA